MDDATCEAAYEFATAPATAAGRPPPHAVAAAASPPRHATAAPGGQQMSGPAALPAGTEAPLCAKHRKPCARRQTQKQGPNFSRWFFCCAEKERAEQCNTFLWEDEMGTTAPGPPAVSDPSVPLCKGHGRGSNRHQVKKPGPNQGFWFFRCSA
jgi:hypothetical protein